MYKAFQVFSILLVTVLFPLGILFVAAVLGGAV